MKNSSRAKFFSLDFNPWVSAGSFRFFVGIKCKYKIKLFTKNRSNHIRVRHSRFFFLIFFLSIKFHEVFLYTTSNSINNDFIHKTQSNFLPTKKEKRTYIFKTCQKKFLLFFSIHLKLGFFCRAKALIYLMTYFCYVKYVTAALIKEAR